MGGIVLGDRDAFVGWVGCIDGGERGRIKGGRVVEQEAAVEWGEAGVQVIEARVYQME